MALEIPIISSIRMTIYSTKNKNTALVDRSPRMNEEQIKDKKKPQRTELYEITMREINLYTPFPCFPQFIPTGSQ